ncbi:four helix bundle protein [Adhaeribacter sp. BT258]|uniref:Four helix bundle protein n=1 Tax=Adhaeribacter terrigena TaxID=2793070 RepID=A0ABS1C2V7_9BACT|nr:four helix bundle protein [Adhaeribacter terrigena]MBK0403735.1 four helix bundle protein [Adhaeribacter terrigena]
MEEIKPPGSSENAIVNKSFQFALTIIQFADSLESERKYIIANQLLKSGTSVGANIWEAQHAESKADFIHKLKIASKEAKETEYWLLLCKSSSGYPEISDKLDKLLEIQKLLSRIIHSSKKS